MVFQADPSNTFSSREAGSPKQTLQRTKALSRRPESRYGNSRLLTVTISSPGSPLILRAVNNGTVDLNVTNFDAVLRETPATYALVEFFAHWCPACRNFKPHYEKVARLFNGPDAVYPGMLLMTRVDCASKINTKLCDNFSVSHYPMLFWGPPSKFVSAGWEPKQEKSDIQVIDNGHTADRLLSWINKQMGSSFGLEDRISRNVAQALSSLK
ncbi:sulfhydryl oxidase 2 [Rosa chinensis]|uniref:thiol oxidase n=1 Tax=Rosa chinensis TaxID=74649 RepID=UPI000D08686E|nr:thiol oxidase [Rosa chinensis]